MFAADVQYDTLARSLLIAVVIVSPYGAYKVHQVRSARRIREAAEAAATAPPPPVRPRLEDVIDDIGDRAADLDDTPSLLTIPRGVTVGGDDPPPGLVDALVRDALRRSGLIATNEIDTPDGRVVEIHRRST